MAKLIGTNPDQVPLNQYLGSLAFQNEDFTSVGVLSANTINVSNTVNVTNAVSANSLTLTNTIRIVPDLFERNPGGQILTSTLMGLYNRRNAGSSTYANVEYDDTVSNYVTSIDANFLNFLSQSRDIISQYPQMDNASANTPRMAIGTSHGTRKAGLAFITGTTSDVLSFGVGGATNWTANTTAVLVGFPRSAKILLQDRDLAPDSVGYGNNVIRYITNTHVFLGNTVINTDTNELSLIRGRVSIGNANTANTRLEVNLVEAVESSLMNAGAVNDVLVLRAPFSANAASSNNFSARWGLRLAGRNDNIFDNTKSAGIYAVSEDTIAGYNRTTGLALHTSSFDGTHTERLRISGSGNVGINIANTNARLHVENTNDGVSIIASAIAQTASQLNMGVGVLTAGRPFVGTNTSTNPLEIGTRAAVETIFVTNSVERWRLDATGNLQGNTSATELGSGFNNFQIQGFSGSIIQAQANGTSVKCALSVDTTEGRTGTRTNHPLQIITNNSIRATVAANGNFGVNVTSPTQLFEVGGNARVTSFGVGTAASGVTGEIRASNNITAYFSSDRTQKENIRDIDNAIVKVQAIGGKYFDWTDEYIAQHGGVDDYFLRKSDFGVIAQDVQSVFPIAVREKTDGKLAVDYEKLCALAFAAIKELKEEIEVLKKKIE